jgi:hypothetical protein
MAGSLGIGGDLSKWSDEELASEICEHLESFLISLKEDERLATFVALPIATDIP